MHEITKIYIDILFKNDIIVYFHDGSHAYESDYHIIAQI